MKNGGLKTLGLIATIAGMGLTLVNSYVDDKKLDEKIDKKLNEREQKNNETSEEVQ